MNTTRTLPALLAVATLAAAAAPTTATAQWLPGDDIAAPTVVEAPTCYCPAPAYAYAPAYGYAASAYEGPGYGAADYGYAAPTCGGQGYGAPAYGYAAPAYGYAASAYEEPVYRVPAYGYAAPAYGYAPSAYEGPVYGAPAYGYARRVFAHAPSAYGYAGRGFAYARPSPGLRPAVARVAASPTRRSLGLRPTVTAPGGRVDNTPILRTASRSRPSAGAPAASNAKWPRSTEGKRLRRTTQGGELTPRRVIILRTAKLPN
jgi:hypothetical protein